jgi:hypothetical protein
MQDSSDTSAVRGKSKAATGIGARDSPPSIFETVEVNTGDAVMENFKSSSLVSRPEELARLICSKKEFLYDCLSRNQYFLPTVASPLCSSLFLREVRTGKVWCMRTNEIKTLNCPSPPTLATATQQLLDALANCTLHTEALQAAKRRLLQHLDIRRGDLRWTLSMLATLKTHGCSTPIFDSDYKPPKKTTVANPTISADVLALLSNEDGLFSNVPTLTVK